MANLTLILLCLAVALLLAVLVRAWSSIRRFANSPLRFNFHPQRADSSLL